MSDFEFDRADAVTRETYAVKIFGKKATEAKYETFEGYTVRADKNEHFSHRFETKVGPFHAKATAERVRDFLLEELNSPAELDARVAKLEEDQREAHEKYEAETNRKARALVKAAREAVKREGIELKEGDVFLTPYNPSGWGRDNRWYDVKVTNGKLTASQWGGDESKSAAIREAKEDEDHTGRIVLLLDDHKGKRIEWVRKGQRIERETVGVWRVYHGEYKSHRSRNVTKTRMVRVNADGEIVSNGWRVSREGEPVEFDTTDEARAWIDERKASYDVFTYESVEKIVKGKATA